MPRVLVDTNVWLEMLLNQEHAADVREFLLQFPLSQIAITDFAIHSIGIIMLNDNKDADFFRFVSDTLEDTVVLEVRLETSELKSIRGVRAEYGLDFDDAYQYVAAEKHQMAIVSFDADFDRTERGRKTPAQILEEVHHVDNVP